MDSTTKKVLIAIIERGWKNGYLIPLAEEALKTQDVDKYLDNDFLKKYTEGSFDKKYGS